METYYYYLKALHIVGFVAWFAGLFYLVRIFVYHAEAAEKPQPDCDILSKQFGIMEQRVYKIICMLYLQPEWLKMGWMHIKLTLLFLLLGYHLYCKRIIKKFASGDVAFNSFQFRLLNEVPTLFLVSIVLLAVLKDTLSFGIAMAGVLVFGILLYFIAKAYKRSRERKKEEN